MTKIILRGWLPESTRPLIPLVKALRAHLACTLPEAVDLAEQCTYYERVVTRGGLAPSTAHQLAEELRALAFDSAVEA